MGLTLRREGEIGLARYGSLHLLSALLVLVGGLVALRPRDEAFPWSSLRFVFATQVAYQLLLVAALAFLVRARRRRGEALLLLPLLALFVFDGLFIQHRYGWAETLGREAAVLGALSGLLALGAAAWTFGVRLSSRLFATSAAALLFVRFGPTLVDVLKSPGALVPGDARLHAYGALLALCLLPVCVLREPGGIERELGPGALLLPLGLAFAHFGAVVARESPDGAAALLAPFAILLGPAIWRAASPKLRQVRAVRLAAHGLPVMGLFLAASTTIPTLLKTAWARRFPLTPFWTALVLFAAVCVVCAAVTRRRPYLHAAAAAVGLAVMGGDLPEILARIAFPSPWQAPVVALLAYGTLALVPHPRSGLLLQVLPAALLDGFLASFGLPRGLGYAIGAAAGILVVTRTTGTRLPRLGESGLWLLLTLPAALTLVLYPWWPALVLAASLCAIAALAGSLLKEPLALVGAGASVLVGVLGCACRFQVAAGVSAGPLLIEAGFFVLAVALLDASRGAAALPLVERGLRPE